MCYNSNLSQRSWSVVGAGKRKKRNPSLLSLSLRIQVYHPHTRTYVRLLGPCFKTGRLKPLGTASPNQRSKHPRNARQHTSAEWKRKIQSYKAGQYGPTFFEQYQFQTADADQNLKIPPNHANTTPQHADNGHIAEGLTRNSSTPSKQRFQSLPFQQFQALLTLISKSFSSFLHSTCSLSVSREYLALCETYHTFSAQIPMNATQ